MNYYSKIKKKTKEEFLISWFIAGKKIHGKKAPPRGKEPKFRISSETEKEDSICVSTESEDEDTQESSVAMDCKLNEGKLILKIILKLNLYHFR